MRSGELWLRDIETRPAPPDLTNHFPAATQFVRCVRTVVNKATGEIRFRETEYGLTSAHAPASKLYQWWRGHWQIENCSHNKRDTIWREDACRVSLRRGEAVRAKLPRHLPLYVISRWAFFTLKVTGKYSGTPGAVVLSLVLPLSYWVWDDKSLVS